MPRPLTRASPSSAGTLLSTVMLLAIIVTTTWGRRPRHRPPALQRRRDPCLACQERRRAPRWAGARVELSTILCRDPGCCEHDPCRSRARRSSEPQRVPVHGPWVFLFFIRPYHVEQGRGRALSGSGRPLARTSAGLARGSGGSRSQRSRVLHAIHCAAASPRPSKPRAWFADNRISRSAHL